MKFKLKNLHEIRFAFLKQLLILFLLSMAVLYFVYSSGINIPFYHHDIYKFSYGGFHQACRSVPGFSFLVTLGRPFSAYIECINNTFGNTFAGVKLLRVGCVFLMALTMSWLAVILQRRNLSFWTAFLLSGAVFFLPAMQTVIIMIAMNIIIAILLAWAGCYFVVKSEYLYTADKLRAMLFLCGGIGLVLTAFFTYPSMPAVFLLPVFISLLFQPLSKWSATRAEIIRHVLIYGFCAVVFFVLAKLLQMYRAPGGVPSSYRFALNFHLWDRLVSLYQSFSMLWNIDAGRKQELIINIIIVMGGLSALARFLKPRTLPLMLLAQAVIALMILLVLAASVYLMAPMDGPPFSRVIFVFQAMSILVVYWSLVSIGQWFSVKKEKIMLASSALLFFMGAYYANVDVGSSALNDYTELSYITTQLANRMNESESFKRIHIISPAQNSYTGLPRHEDIFNVSSTLYAGDITNIVNAALLQLTPSLRFTLKNCIFSEAEEQLYAREEADCIESAPFHTIVVTYSRPLAPIVQSPDTLVIDMNKLILSNTSNDSQYRGLRYAQ